jgi:EAL domain-containing protein (putative c-di-GMP-specific phosphodiesterase class I)
LRWNHPTRGVVSPAVFIPLAEQSDLIVAIGEWVLTEACRQASAWCAGRFADEMPTISVNVSARQLDRSDGFVATVRRVLLETGLDPALLKLEITESTVMRDPELAIATLWALKGLGVHLVVDDFGTGYSSLAYLKRFPVDTLKIDRAFVDGLAYLPEDRAIVAAIVAFAHTLGLTTVAEGIETDEQADSLRELGCRLGQGYLFGRPAPAVVELRRSSASLAA